MGGPDRSANLPTPEEVENEMGRPGVVERFFYEFRGLPLGRSVLEEYVNEGIVPDEYVTLAERVREIAEVGEVDEGFAAIAAHPQLPEALLLVAETQRFTDTLRGKKVGIGRDKGRFFTRGDPFLVVEPQDLEGTSMPEEMRQAVESCRGSSSESAMFLFNYNVTGDERNPLGETRAQIMFRVGVDHMPHTFVMDLEINFSPEGGGIDCELSTYGWSPEKLRAKVGELNELPDAGKFKFFAKTLLGLQEVMARVESRQ